MKLRLRIVLAVPMVAVALLLFVAQPVSASATVFIGLNAGITGNLVATTSYINTTGPIANFNSNPLGNATCPGAWSEYPTPGNIWLWQGGGGVGWIQNFGAGILQNYGITTARYCAWGPGGWVGYPDGGGLNSSNDLKMVVDWAFGPPNPGWQPMFNDLGFAGGPYPNFQWQVCGPQLELVGYGNGTIRLRAVIYDNPTPHISATSAAIYSALKTSTFYHASINYTGSTHKAVIQTGGYSLQVTGTWGNCGSPSANGGIIGTGGFVPCTIFGCSSSQWFKFDNITSQWPVSGYWTSTGQPFIGVNTINVTYHAPKLANGESIGGVCASCYVNSTGTRVWNRSIPFTQGGLGWNVATLNDTTGTGFLEQAFLNWTLAVRLNNTYGISATSIKLVSVTYGPTVWVNPTQPTEQITVSYLPAILIVAVIAMVCFEAFLFIRDFGDWLLG